MPTPTGLRDKTHRFSHQSISRLFPLGVKTSPWDQGSRLEIMVRGRDGWWESPGWRLAAMASQLCLLRWPPNLYSEMPPGRSVCPPTFYFWLPLAYPSLLPFLCEKLNDTATAEEKHSLQIQLSSQKPGSPMRPFDVLCVFLMRKEKVSLEILVGGQSTPVHWVATEGWAQGDMRESKRVRSYFMEPTV